MKRILLVLAMLNAGLYLYWHVTDSVPPTLSAAPAVSPPTIQLASERPAPDARCQALGPIHSLSVLAAVKTWLGDRFGSVQEREDIEDGTVLYRVQALVPDEAAAAGLVRRLNANGDRDVATLGTRASDGSVVVSFGQFSERPRAERREKDLQGRGIKATVEAGHAQWWLDFTSVDNPDTAALLKTVPEAEGVAVGPCPAPPSEDGPVAEPPAKREGASPTTGAPPVPAQKSASRLRVA